jgi:ATP:ADP antiporter, AAA family
MGAGESVKFLSQSPYIRDLAALVVGYGMAINIVEVRAASFVSCPL